MVKRGLGKGFEALIPTDLVEESFDPTAAEDEKISDLRVLPVKDITPDPNQPRRHFEEEALQALADSIREHGVLQPIVVVPKQGGYEIVAGERRWRAAKLADQTKIPAIIRTLGAQHKLELSIIENVQRTDLNPLETATAYLKLKNQFNMTDTEIAKRVGKALSTISNQMRLLGLPDYAKEVLIQGGMTEGHARQILALPDDKAKLQLFDNIVRDGWTVRKCEQFVIGYKKGMKESSVAARSGSAHKAILTETDVTKAIAARAGLKPSAITQKTTAHGGAIIIKFADDTELAQIKRLLGK
ncbi:MAG: ParB/RepB/Spo0J family partition protein [Sphaerimonospora mesophila]